jgi:GT2 family glycosyltransferase
MNATADIIVPVWNRPVETRECLVSLMRHSPGVRLVMVDTGSDRQTESLLEEFSESLGERALLLRTEVNEGFIRAVNRGLARVSAPWGVVVRNTSVVTAGWLDQLVEPAATDAAAGLLVPRFLRRGERKGKGTECPPCREATPVRFDAIGIRKEVIDSCGLFDEGLDGGEWSLKDYARRAWRSGFLSLHSPGSVVAPGEETIYGSESRREETLRRARETYRERWGEENDFLIFFPGKTETAAVDSLADLLLQGARQGHRFTLLLDSRLHRNVTKGWFGSLHQSIRFEPLPILFADGALRKRVVAWRELFPSGTVIAGGDAGGIEAEPVETLRGEIEARLRETYCTRG